MFWTKLYVFIDNLTWLITVLALLADNLNYYKYYYYLYA